MGNVHTNWEAVCKDMWTFLLTELSAYLKGDGPVSAQECNYGQAATQTHLEALVQLVEKYTTATPDPTFGGTGEEGE